MGSTSKANPAIYTLSLGFILLLLDSVSRFDGMSTEDRLFLVELEVAMCMQVCTHLAKQNKDLHQLTVKLNADMNLVCGRIQQQAWGKEELINKWIVQRDNFSVRWMPASY